MQRQKANVLLSVFSRFKSVHITASFLFALALLAPAANADPVDWTAYKKGFTISFPGYRGTHELPGCALQRLAVRPQAKRGAAGNLELQLDYQRVAHGVVCRQCLT